VNKTACLGIVLTVYGLVVLAGAVAACPAKHASVSVSLFMVLAGAAFFALGRDIEKLRRR